MIQVPIGAVGIHAKPWPGASRPVWPQRAVSSDPLNRVHVEATLPLASMPERQIVRWSISDRGTAGPLDRVAQIAERKYCRPHARPFRLRFERVVAVFPSLLACCALGPLASAAQYSCRREPCTGRWASLPLGRACLSAGSSA